MDIEVRETGGVHIIHPVTSRLTAASGADELHQKLDDAIKQGRLAVAVDLAGVAYADSTAIGALIDAYKHLTKDGGTICAFNVESDLAEFIQQTWLDRFIDVVANESLMRAVFESRPKKIRRGIGRLFS